LLDRPVEGGHCITSRIQPCIGACVTRHIDMSRVTFMLALDRLDVEANLRVRRVETSFESSRHLLRHPAIQPWDVLMNRAAHEFPSLDRLGELRGVVDANPDDSAANHVLGLFVPYVLAHDILILPSSRVTSS